MRRRVVCSVFNLFMIMLHSKLVSSQLPSDQVSAMSSVYEILQNNTAPNSFVWNDVLNSSNPCSWWGVGCTPDNSSINTISFEFFSISTSEFLPYLCNISTLESLDVSNNLLSSIPVAFFTDCGGISGLKILNFGGNNLIGPLPSFSNGFRVLEKLDFSGNSLSGEISLQLDELDSLKSLDLGWNEFTGKIPTNLGKLNLLENLVLSFNLFSGEIPIEITNYKNLTFIDLSSNRLSGSVPREFGELSMLQTLLLSSNSLSGEIPTSISSITTLEGFSADQNMLNGTIPLGITSNLAYLYLSNNSLRGTIPSDLLSGPNLKYLDLSFNGLEGPIPPITSRNLLSLRISSNLLNGTIPSPLFGSNLGLMSLELDNNSLSVEIPSELGLCKNLYVINLAKNRLRGTLPPSLGNLTNLHDLNLESNSLGGSIPNSIAGLYYLMVLQLGSNQLNGRIPRMPEYLTTLNLSHNLFEDPIPSTLSTLWRRLEVLDLSNNRFSGEIPKFLAEFFSLTHLLLMNNDLSGVVPTSIEGLSSLMVLQLGSNQLNGRIPHMPESLTALNLSHNLFEDPIPSTLSTLWRSLQVLDLSNNRFSGEIPNFLAEFLSLTHLLLMNNDLSGVVPKFSDRVKVDTRPGNDRLMYGVPALVPHMNTEPVFDSSDVAVAATSGFPVGLVISVIAIFISRRYKSIHHHLSPPSSILRSAIDLKKGMKAVSDPSNITHEARFSTFYKAVMPSGSTYLVKKVNHSHSIFHFPRIGEVSKELQVLGNLSHPNVMIPKAYVLTPRRAYLFYDFARGTLHDVLHHTMGNATSLGWSSRYSIAVGVAKGLAYLHECSSGPVLLLDLCTKSVLLKSLDEPQIGDIELCKFIHPSRGAKSVIAAGNVYSYGVLLLELLSGKPAVSDGGAELAEWALTLSEEESQRGKILDPSIEETSIGVRSQMLGVLEVALACVSVSPQNRPNAVTVLQMLQRRSKIVDDQRL